MPKKRTNKTIPEHLKAIERTNLPENASNQKKAKAYNDWAGRYYERMQLQLDEVLENEFYEIGNPLFAWDAYALARRLEEDIPEWVLKYLDMVAKRLANPKNEVNDLGKCMGFQKGSGPGQFKEYYKFLQKRTALFHLLNELEKNPKSSVDDACKLAAKQVKRQWGVGIKQDTIKKWYYQME